MKPHNMTSKSISDGCRAETGKLKGGKLGHVKKDMLLEHSKPTYQWRNFTEDMSSLLTY
jgi:hypothetical protein